MKLREITSWSTKKKRSTNGFPLFSITIPLRENVRHCPSSLERNWKSETLTMLFPEPPVVAFRRLKSIKDTLCRAAVSRPSSTVGQCKPCGDKRCKSCLQLQHAHVFHSNTTGKEYTIFCNVHCTMPNVVYPLDCHVWGSQCVGESVQLFNKRMNGHRSDLTKKTLSPVSQHFVSPGHSLDDCQIQNVYHWQQSKLERESKAYKREFFGSASYKHYIRRT